MTKFNPEGKDVLTFGECLGPAMDITDQDDADQYFKDYVAYTQRHIDEDVEDQPLSAEEVVRENLGYFAGYYDGETRTRVERLFACAHPVFGAIAEKGTPTPEEAFEMGRELAGKHLSEKKEAENG